MLKIVYKNLNEISAYKTNSRTHDTEQINQLAESIKQFGFTNPVLIDEDGTLIAGHGRLEAAKLVGESSIPTITIEGLTHVQRKALVIADNKLAMNAGWNFEMLAAEIDFLNDQGFDLSLLGFDQSELNDLIGTPNEPPDPEEIESQDPDETQKLTFELNAEQFFSVTKALNLGISIGMLDSSNNAKANGEALAFVCELFTTQNAGKG
jgi:ParB-like chromosome segregation protein Spo0J